MALSDTSERLFRKYIGLKGEEVIEIDSIKYVKDRIGNLVRLQNRPDIGEFRSILLDIDKGVFSSFSSSRRRNPLEIGEHYRKYVLLHYLYDKNKLMEEKLNKLEEERLEERIIKLENVVGTILGKLKQ